MRNVGSILKKARLEQGLALEEVFQKTKIQPRFLQALEDGDYEAFSSPIHLKGFLKNYAGSLGLRPSEVLAFWRREFDEVKRETRLISRVSPLASPRLAITPTAVVLAFASLMVFAFFAYLFYQFRALAGPPKLVVLSPPDRIQLLELSVRAEGRVDKDAALFVNGQKVDISPDGKFLLKFDLAPGLNTLQFVAVNKLERKTVVERTVFAEPPP